MFSNSKNFLKVSTLAIVLMTMSSISASAQAPDIDGLPPQPAQSTLPEDAAPMGAPVQKSPMQKSKGLVVDVKPATTLTKVVEDAKVVAEPVTPLNDVQPEPVVGQAVQEAAAVPYSGTYYDADSIGPSELGATAGPRKVDPRYEPGSSFVVVKKNASATSRQATLVAAQRALKLQRYSSALELYEKLYKKNSRNKQILMGLAVSQQYNGFTESAIATYEELLKIDSRHSGAMVNLMGLLELQQPGIAYRKLQDLWSNGGNNPAVAAQLGLASAKMGDYEDSSRYLGIAASLEPDNALNYYNLAVVMDQAEAHQSAIEYYQKALEVDIAHKGGQSIPREQVYDRLAQLRRL